MIVTRENVAEVIDYFSRPGRYGFDTETTGLDAYNGDRPFCLTISDGARTVYFDWSDGEPFLDPSSIFANPESTFYAHNAKFDMAMLDAYDVQIHGTIHCTMAIHRLIDNQLMSYSLDNLVKPLGLHKEDAVKDYIAKNGLYTVIKEAGKKQKTKLLHYDQVPKDLIVPYAEHDAYVAHQLGEYQRDYISKSGGNGFPSLERLYASELAVTKVFYRMEKRGIRVDLDFCKRAVIHEEEEIRKGKEEFKGISGMDFKDSGKALSKAFIALDLDYPKTAKGNPSFTDKMLVNCHHPIADSIRRIRTHEKRLGTYFLNFIKKADPQHNIHADGKQGGTATGRVSYAEPNLQNLPKPSATPTPFDIRRAFKPRPGKIFVMIDYDQMEYRLLLDMVQEQGVIKSILEQDLDVHTATAEKMGVSRTYAKTINFMLLYGGGVEKLGESLGVPYMEAKTLRSRYFSSLPRVKRFSQEAKRVAERRGWVFNWLGRRLKFRDGQYRATNHLIQGGCADVCKQAMIKVDELLRDLTGIDMLVQVHDELLFEMEPEKVPMISQIVEIMESAYPHKSLPLTVGVSWSAKSWADKIEGMPNVKEARDSVQREGVAGYPQPSDVLCGQDSAGSYQGYA